MKIFQNSAILKIFINFPSLDLEGNILFRFSCTFVGISSLPLSLCLLAVLASVSSFLALLAVLASSNQLF